MNKIRRKLRLTSAMAVITVGALLALLLTACSSDKSDKDASDVKASGTAVVESKDQLCSDLTGVKSALNDMDKLGPNSTVNDAKKAHQKLQDSIDKTKQSAQGVSQAVFTAMSTASSAIADRVNNVPGDQTLGSINTALTALETQVGQAVSSLQQDKKCPTA